ncbi:uncharacterized protein [Clytia hemisphaerica]|uniref:uncharacterized protein n=1 Tax=Clytia hemisphaerica TaxID=252671 RepID=UPI0034D71555
MDETMMEEELPLPEEDDNLVDLKYIHWGYLNCCQTLYKGRKAKHEVWNTYWVTLCGTTLRFYLDAAMHPDSVFHAPPSSPFGPLQENQHKVAFFELDGAELDMLDDGKVFRRRLRKSVYSKIYRQHLFQVKLNKIHSTYAFQASSQSSLFTWISKLQESIDAIENNEISF